MHTQRNTYACLLPTALLVFVMWHGSFAGESVVSPAVAMEIAIRAGDLRMVLENTGQGLRLAGLTDQITNQELCPTEPAPLFSVVLRDVQTKDLLTITADTGWKQVDTTFSGATRMHAFTFAAPTDDRLEGIEVKVTVDVDDPNSALIWDLRVANDNPRWALWRIVFPQAAVRDLGEDAKVFAQVTSGVELSEMWSKGGRRGGPYPGGWTCMQYMAAYNRADGTGLYVGMHDPFGSTKTIFAEGQPAKEAVLFTFDHAVPDMGKPGVDFDLPGKARWQLLRGDWFDAAQIYRAWASREARWWPALGADGREDTPKWMRELPAWVMTGGPASDCVPRVRKFAETIDLPTGFHWYNWHQIPFDNDYPHYFPVKDGFTEGVAELKTAGVHPMPYINGRLWDTRDKGAEDWAFSRTALPAATKDEDGKPCTESYGSKETDGNSVTLAVMCPTTPVWQDRVGDIVLRLFNEYGVSGVYIDQIAAAQPRLCFDASHGHQLGGGHWWTEGYWKMLDAIRAAMPAGDMLTTECNAEPFIKWLDGYLTWHWQQQDMVPAFSAVYGGTVQMFGRAYRGGPTQDLANRMKAAQQLVYGEQIGWFGPEIIERADCWPFLRDCIQLRWRLREYFYRGHMARPPHLAGPVPRITADWQWSGEWLVTTDAITTGAWRIPQDNKLVLLFTNVSDSPYAGRLDLNPADYGLAGGSLKVTAIQPDGTQRPLRVEAVNHANVELPARSIISWEVRPASDK
ncbi:MAG: DUF6259 domain-containing protein [Planctomycetota bacterium]|nr:DUF6259 domain-containing protein [Planctomycetota bacterium]